MQTNFISAPMSHLLSQCLLVMAVLCCFFTGSSWAQEAPSLQGKPKWEFGVGAGYFDGFGYPGSLDSNRRRFGLPFFIYRSKRLRFGGGGISAVAVEEPRLKLDWSLAASLNASSENNSARAGMDDLDFLFEIGPQLVWRAIDVTATNGVEYRLDWSTKLRGVISTDFASAKDRGLGFETAFAARIRNFGGQQRVSLIGRLSARAGTQRLHDYFYEVPEKFVTATRPAYDARGGLVDVRATAGVALNLPKRVRVFVAATTGFYQDSANRDSPLHRAISSTSAAVGVIWTIAESAERVTILDTD